MKGNFCAFACAAERVIDDFNLVECAKAINTRLPKCPSIETTMLIKRPLVYAWQEVFSAKRD